MDDPIDFNGHGQVPQMPPMVEISAQTLYQMHLSNSRRLGALEHTSKDTAHSLLTIGSSNGRIEAKLDVAIANSRKIDDVAEDLNQAKGLGIFITIAGIAAGLWEAFHGKG